MTTITVARLLAKNEKAEEAVALAKSIPTVFDGKREILVRHLDGYEFTPSPDKRRWGGRVEWQAEVL